MITWKEKLIKVEDGQSMLKASGKNKSNCCVQERIWTSIDKYIPIGLIWDNSSTLDYYLKTSDFMPNAGELIRRVFILLKSLN